mmetsp:Transcript_49103/g.97570  ORF Transcript_49103/g.97570 Transcript_49103/m.97570 type:complete len:131 (-) Transcript_49103:71-463(-)
MAHFFLVMFLVRLVVASRHEAGHGKSEIDDDGYMTEVTMENLQKTQMLLEAEIRELYAQKDMLAAENVKLRAENAKLKGGSALLEYEREEKQSVETRPCCKSGLSCARRNKCASGCCAAGCDAKNVGGCR